MVSHRCVLWAVGELNSTDSSTVKSITNETGRCLIGSISCGKFEIGFFFFLGADVVLLNVFVYLNSLCFICSHVLSEFVL